LRCTNVWTDITELFKGKIHPTQKPDALYKRLIETHSNPGDIIYDPCAGSVTTARVARALESYRRGRRFVIVEQEEEYLRKAGLL
jgi:DNA modification methylase